MVEVPVSLARRVIPCLDVDKGRVVKGVRFADIRDAGDPVELAAFYDSEGADEIAILDITASHEGREVVFDLVHRIAEQVFIPVTVAGGVRDNDQVRRLLRSGADKVALNTFAVQTPDAISYGADQFGSQCIVVAIDAKRRESGWEVFTHGGRRETGIDAVEWAERATKLGAGEILLTSMDRDGTKDGYELDLLREVGGVVDVPVIASGGAGTLNHFSEAIKDGRADAVLAASLFHFGELRVGDVKRHLAEHGIPVRL